MNFSLLYDDALRAVSGIGCKLTMRRTGWLPMLILWERMDGVSPKGSKAFRVPTRVPLSRQEPCLIDLKNLNICVYDPDSQEVTEHRKLPLDAELPCI